MLLQIKSKKYSFFFDIIKYLLIINFLFGIIKCILIIIKKKLYNIVFLLSPIGLFRLMGNPALVRSTNYPIFKKLASQKLLSIDTTRMLWGI